MALKISEFRLPECLRKKLTAYFVMQACCSMFIASACICLMHMFGIVTFERL